jgi:hypothetical protein
MTRRVPFRGFRALGAGAILLALGITSYTSARADDAEDAIKSAAVLNFIRYSTWRAPISDPLVVGVVGRINFFNTLRATLQNRPVNGRTVRVIEVKTAVDALTCQLLYLATDRPTEIQPFLSSPVVTHALTIGESDRFLDLGGAVNFYLADGHIAFEACLEAIDKAGVTISSNLLRVGQIRGHTRKRGEP